MPWMGVDGAQHLIGKAGMKTVEEGDEQLFFKPFF